MLFSHFAHGDEIHTVAEAEPTGIGALLGSGLFIAFALAVVVLSIVAAWKVFTKAGKPGWASIVPFYNLYVLVQICGRPGWWFLLMFIPVINFVVYVIMMIDLARKFGKDAVFGVVGLFLFSLIGYLILAFGSAKYDPKA